MGIASATAQKLRAPITSSVRMAGSDHPAYILKDSEALGGKGTVVGLLKVGVKKLFIVDEKDAMHEIMPLCVLDFYVHESCQRNGYGKVLFEEMLKRENKLPANLAYDRPSPKFIAFLAKHYSLTRYRPQVNNFVVFYDYFHPARPVSSRAPRHSSAPSASASIAAAAPPAPAVARPASGRSVPPLNLGLANGPAPTIQGGRLGSASTLSRHPLLPQIPSQPVAASDTKASYAPARGGAGVMGLGLSSGYYVGGAARGMDAGQQAAGKAVNYSYNLARRPF